MHSRQRIGQDDGGIWSKRISRHLRERTVNYSYAKRVFLKSTRHPRRDREGWPALAGECRQEAPRLISPTLLVKEFKAKFGAPSHSTLSYHAARYVCLCYAVERAEQLLQDPKITDTNVKVPWKVKAGEGVGVVEAPRGLLDSSLRLEFRWVHHESKSDRADNDKLLSYRSVNEIGGSKIRIERQRRRRKALA